MSDIQTALEAGAALGRHHTVGNLEAPYLVVPEGYKLESLEHLRETPLRTKATVKLARADSFIAYFKRHVDSEVDPQIYATVSPPCFTAIFDDHTLATPGWREHRAIYACPLSPEWQTWIGKNGRQMSQTDFATFIEDNLVDIIAPPGADMLEISRSLEAKKKVAFASTIRLPNGQVEISYEEEIQGSAAKGKLKVPETFTLGIPVFEGGPGYKVEARLRYRIDSAKLSMWFDLVRPHKILEDAVAMAAANIEEQTGLKILYGIPG